MDNSQWPWLIAVLGFVILGIAIAYGITRNRGRTAVERELSAVGTRKVYREEETRMSEKD